MLWLCEISRWIVFLNGNITQCSRATICHERLLVLCHIVAITRCSNADHAAATRGHSISLHILRRAGGATHSRHDVLDLSTFIYLEHSWIRLRHVADSTKPPYCGSVAGKPPVAASPPLLLKYSWLRRFSLLEML